ncbi:unnamed protein product [Pedinophyceae sp. YPF-701]|nr:unnamed protein product [Pedinophyceae sp. YPF-701]
MYAQAVKLALLVVLLASPFAAAARDLKCVAGSACDGGGAAAGVVGAVTGAVGAVANSIKSSFSQSSSVGASSGGAVSYSSSSGMSAGAASGGAMQSFHGLSAGASLQHNVAYLVQTTSQQQTAAEACAALFNQQLAAMSAQQQQAVATSVMHVQLLDSSTYQDPACVQQTCGANGSIQYETSFITDQDTLSAIEMLLAIKQQVAAQTQYAISLADVIALCSVESAVVLQYPVQSTVQLQLGRVDATQADCGGCGALSSGNAFYSKAANLESLFVKQMGFSSQGALALTASVAVPRVVSTSTTQHTSSVGFEGVSSFLHGCSSSSACGSSLGGAASSFGASLFQAGSLSQATTSLTSASSFGAAWGSNWSQLCSVGAVFA